MYQVIHHGDTGPKIVGEAEDADQLFAIGFTIHGSYGKRRTAESIADKLRKEGKDTAVREDRLGNHVIYTRPHED